LQGLKALHSPHTGIVDWGEVTRSYARNFQDVGGDIHLNYCVEEFRTTSDADYPVDVVGAKPVSI
jgi:2-hydroxyglutarate dehydrogenase